MLQRYGRMPECKRKCLFSISLLEKREEEEEECRAKETSDGSYRENRLEQILHE